MRQVQVFKWSKERDGDGKLQNVRTQDGMATFHQFGAAYEEFENGAGSYAIAIIERPDGSVQQVSADMIQFVDALAFGVPAANADLRDRFAAKAMHGMMTSDCSWSELGYTPADTLSDIEQVARFAYQMADTMLAERAK